MNNNYSQQITQILQYSKEEAIRLNNDYIGPEHIMLGIIRDGKSKAVDVLQRQCNLNLAELKQMLEKRVRNSEVVAYMPKDVTLNEKSSGVLRLCILESRLMRSKTADVEHLLLAIMKQKDNLPAKMLEDSQVKYDTLFQYFSKPATAPKNNVDVEDDEEEDTPPSNRGSVGEGTSTATRTEKKQGKGTDTPAIDSSLVELLVMGN